MTSETFEQIVNAAQVSGDYRPAWKKFFRTKFFVPILRSPADGAGKGFSLCVTNSSKDGKPALLVSETLERVNIKHGNETASISGAEILKLLHPEAGIMVALSDRGLSIPATLAARLKQSLQAAQAAALAAKQEAQAVKPEPQAQQPTAAKPAIDDWRAEPKAGQTPPPESAKAETAPRLSSVAALSGMDVTALRPRHVLNANLGLEFYVPDFWQETKNARSLQIVDPLSNTKIEATGMERTGVPLAQWVQMRLPLVAQEMPYMTPVGEPYPLVGDEWRNRIQASVAQYQGTIPGDNEKSTFLIVCLRTDNILISLTILAKSAVFEKNRALYKWLLSRIDISDKTPYAAPTPGATAAPEGHDEDDEQIGKIASGQRLLQLAIVGNFVAMGVVKTLHPGMILFFGLAVICMSIFGLMRMAKGLGWSLGAKIGLWICCFVPLANLVVLFIINRKASNRLRDAGYRIGLLGAPDAIPSENHDMRNVLVVALVLSLPLFWLGKRASAPPDAPIVAFSPPDRSYTIDMPGTPKELPPNPNAGDAITRAYQLTVGQWSYAVDTVDLPAPPADMGAALTRVRDSLIKSNQGTILSDTSTSVNGKTARDLRLQSASGAYFAARYFFVGSRMYMVVAGAPPGNEASPKIDAYLDSFHLNRQ